MQTRGGSDQAIDTMEGWPQGLRIHFQNFIPWEAEIQSNPIHCSHLGWTLEWFKLSLKKKKKKLEGPGPMPTDSDLIGLERVSGTVIFFNILPLILRLSLGWVRGKWGWEMDARFHPHHPYSPFSFYGNATL